MTEIVRREERPVEVAPAVASRIQSAAQDMQAAAHIAAGVVNTMFAPAHFKGKIPEAAAAIMYGDTIGMDPMTALQNIHVISGRPGLYARAMVAVVQSKGHEVWTEEAGPTKVVVAGRRKGSEHVERSEWTTERAKRAGYFSNKKYETDPESMLYARASGDVSRRVAPDALLGMAYSIEELQLEENNAPEQQAARSSVSRLRSAVSAPEPATDPSADVIDAELDTEPGDIPENIIPPDVAPDAEPDWAAIEAEQERARATELLNGPTDSAPDAGPEMITRRQMPMLQAMLSGFGVTPTQRHGVVGKILSRHIASMNDLTKDEAIATINTLEQMGSDQFRAEFADVMV